MIQNKFNVKKQGLHPGKSYKGQFWGFKLLVSLFCPEKIVKSFFIVFKHIYPVKPPETWRICSRARAINTTGGVTKSVSTVLFYLGASRSRRVIGFKHGSCLFGVLKRTRFLVRSSSDGRSSLLALHREFRMEKYHEGLLLSHPKKLFSRSSQFLVSCLIQVF